MGEGIAEKAKEIKGKKRGSTGGGEGGAAGGDLDEQGQGQGKPTTNNKKKGGTAYGGEGKMKASPVVPRVDLHCHGCALKVKKAIKAAQGVEGVETDMAGSTVTMSSKPDPWELKERIEYRAHKTVAFVSPPNPPKKKKNASADASKKPATAQDQVTLVQILNNQQMILNNLQELMDTQLEMKTTQIEFQNETHNSIAVLSETVSSMEQILPTPQRFARRRPNTPPGASTSSALATIP